MRNNYDENKRFLISVNVVGSAGPLRLVVSESDSVKRVISSALKLYAHQGRLPVLALGASSFHLFPTNSDFNALDPAVLIGSLGVRNFSLCRKKTPLKTEMEVAKPQKKKGNWKRWIYKLLYNHHSHRSNNLITC